MKASINANNYRGIFLPGLTFSYKQSVTENWLVSAGLTHENYIDNFLYGNLVYKTPQKNAYGGFFGLGALYTTDFKSLSPGFSVVAGVFFPKNTILQFSAGLIMNPQNLFSFRQHISEIKIEFMPALQKTAIIARYDRKSPDAGDISRTIALKIQSTAYNPQRNFSLTVNLGTAVALKNVAFNDLTVSSRFGGAYHTKKAGSYGLFVDVDKSLYNLTEAPKFAVGFEYDIDL